ncbi:MAG: MarR family winged helix-turn-helix transcriptional regulator [Chloroflexota bacterium]
MSMLTADERESLLERLVTAITTVRTSLGMKPTELAHLGIGKAGFTVLTYLDVHGPSRMSEIAAALGVTSASVTGITGNLVRDGYVRRLPDQRDRRVVRVEITDRGREKLNEVKKSRQEHAGSVLAAVSDSDLRTFVELIERLSLAIAARPQPPETDDTGDVGVQN